MIKSIIGMRKSKGLTIVELLIVMSVLVLLIATPLIAFKGLQNEAKKMRAQSDLKLLKCAIESYYKNHNCNYPPESDYQNILLSALPQIIVNVMNDPFGDASMAIYHYALSTGDPNTSQYYIVYSPGPEHNGVAMVSNTGVVTASNEVIWDSNGKMY